MLLFVVVYYCKGERVIYDSFISPEFVEKLVQFYSLEENKGQDRFDTRKFTLFKVRLLKFSVLP